MRSALGAIPFILVPFCFGLSLECRPSHALAASADHAKILDERLNPTGRVIRLFLPLRDGEQVLGEIGVRIGTDDQVFVPRSRLMELLDGVVDVAVRQELEAGTAQETEITLASLNASGLDLRFDKSQLELHIYPSVDQRPIRDLQATQRRNHPASPNQMRPAQLSSYVNIVAGVTHAWGDASESRTGLHLDLQSATRFSGIVLENDAVYESAVDRDLCPIFALCFDRHAEGFKRQRSRFIFDDPERQVRWQAGDADVNATGIQRSLDVLGITVEKSPQKLAPGSRYRAQSGSTLRIARPSNVSLLINGTRVRNFRLQPGHYNLNDLPLSTGVNDIEVEVTDDFGRLETFTYSQAFDHRLLGVGETEWSVSGGVPSNYADGERVYRDDDFLGSGFFRYGLGNAVTAEAHLQTDSRIVMGGTGMLTATPAGLFGLGAALSSSSIGMGYAVDASWERWNYAGLFSQLTDRPEQFSVDVEYRSPEFRTPAEHLITASQILYPQHNYWLKVLANYSFPVAWNITAILAARYQFVDPDQFTLSPLNIRDDQFGLDLTITGPLSQSSNASLTVGYSNEFYSLNARDTIDPDFRIMARFYVRPGPDTSVTASYDSLNRHTLVSANRNIGRGLGRWETAVDVTHNGYDDRGIAGGSIKHYGNRAEVGVAHVAGMGDLFASGLNPRFGDQRSTIRVGTAIAFADGHVALGAPVRGDAFAIVYPHESLSENDIIVGSQGDVRGIVDVLGPAVVSQLPAYSQYALPIDVAELPVGYSLGQGAFDLAPPYKGGFALQVGSERSVYAYGTLLHANGSPAALLTGAAYPAGQPDDRILYFTNSSGRFGAEGLGPGAWVLELDTNGQTQSYHINIPDGVEGLYQTGALSPVE